MENGKNSLEGTDIQRWTAKRKAAVVLELIRGKTTTADVARQHGLTVAEVEQWQNDFLSGGEESLRTNPRDLKVRHEAEKKQLFAKIGELSLEVDILKKADAILKRQEEENS